jgi:hypothetical protein
VGKKYSHDRATNCPISFAQICGLVLDVGEQKEPTPLLCVVNKASIWRSLKILEFL